MIPFNRENLLSKVSPKTTSPTSKCVSTARNWPQKIRDSAAVPVENPFWSRSSFVSISMLSTVAPPSSFRILLCASLFHPSPPPSLFFDSEKFPPSNRGRSSGVGLWKALPGEHQASVRSIAAGQFPGLRLWSLSLAGLGLENHTTTYPGPPPLRRPIGWVRLLCPGSWSATVFFWFWF